MPLAFVIAVAASSPAPDLDFLGYEDLAGREQLA
jgi:hypothetical protein